MIVNVRSNLKSRITKALQFTGTPVPVPKGFRGNYGDYLRLHRYIRRIKTKTEWCERCGKVPPCELSNYSGKYKQSISDWEWLCRKCHFRHDGRAKILKDYVASITTPDRYCPSCGRVITRSRFPNLPKYCSSNCLRKVRQSKVTNIKGVNKPRDVKLEQAIKDMYATGDYSQKEVARKFNTVQSTVSLIVNER